MNRTVFAAIAAALIGTASVVAALPMGPVCCACLPALGGQVAGTNRTVTDALFCAQAPPADPDDLVGRCDLAVPPHELECVPSLPGSSCTAELADAGVFCPGAGVPAATAPNALALAVTLAAGGALLLRRRQR